MPIRENSLVHVLKWQGFRGMVRESFTEKRKTALRKNMDQGGFFMEKNRNTVEDKALYYGLQALLETRHSS